MCIKLAFSLILLSLATASAFSQTTERAPDEPKHFLGSTLFIAFNFVLVEPPNYYQLNYGYRITPKDVEAITWTYTGPIGRPYGPDYESTSTDFPGKVRAYGLGLAYKRFLWRGVYAQAHSTAFRQDFLDEGDEKIQSGFQLFNTLRFGYHIKLFENRFFLEPSIAATSWPINTNLPESFQIEEDKWPRYFLFEPGLHFGVNF